jgi:hypothetical protein
MCGHTKDDSKPLSEPVCRCYDSLPSLLPLFRGITLFTSPPFSAWATPKGILKICDKGAEIEEAATLFLLYQKVRIAFRPLIPSGDGTEYPDILCPIS